MCVCMLSCVQLFVTSWTIAHQAPLSIVFARPEYWSGLPFPSPGDLPDPGIIPGSPTMQADSFSVRTTGEASTTNTHPLLPASGPPVALFFLPGTHFLLISVSERPAYFSKPFTFRKTCQGARPSSIPFQCILPMCLSTKNRATT